MRSSVFAAVVFALGIGICLAADLPQAGLLLDLDASRGVELEDGNRVVAWTNQAPGRDALVFRKQDEGRKEAGSGRPTLRKGVREAGGREVLDFRQQELVCPDEGAFDGLTTGGGHTWVAVMAVHEQRVGVKDVNSFFGNLRNKARYEGVWGGLDDDNTLWWGVRNGKTFGRWDANNPKVAGPKLETGKFHVIAGRMSAGQEVAELQLFVNGGEAVATGKVPVVPGADASKLAIGQERDAINHPGHESFDGEIARFLIWERPLADEELGGVLAGLAADYSPATASTEWPGKASNWKGHERYDFEVDGRKCYVVVPEKAAPGNPWVWRARFPGFHAEADLLLLKRGFHVAHMKTDGMLGSPKALDHWDKFYQFLTAEHGLARKVCLEAVSRGGLFAYRWAARHPGRVACIYADTPVLDFKSWPLGQGVGMGDAKTWQRLLGEYGFSEEEALAFKENPVDVLEPIATAKVPLLHIVSLVDKVVPPTENTFVLAERYRKLGGSIEIMEVSEGTRLHGHHFDHPDPKRVADFIEKHTLQANGLGG